MNQNLKNYFKSYKFWISISSALFLILESILKHFNIDLNEKDFMFYVNIILGFFVFLGIISYPTQNEEDGDNSIKNEENEQKNNKNDIK